jgi:hypothetical protein
VKTTIIIGELDTEARLLAYFHNAAYYQLGGEDFHQILRTSPSRDSAALPLFAELVRIDRLVRRPAKELAAIASLWLSRHVSRRAAGDPIARFGGRFAADLPLMQTHGLEHYHKWAFATTRQLGAAMELLAAHLRWLESAGGIKGLEEPAADFYQVSSLAKAFILKGARTIRTKRPLDNISLLDDMSAAWTRGMSALAERLTPTPVQGDK